MPHPNQSSQPTPRPSPTVASTEDPTQRSAPGVTGQTGLFHLMDALARRRLEDDAMQDLANALASAFNIPHPAVRRNNRLTTTLGRCTTTGVIELGHLVHRADTLVHEFAHHLTWRRHSYQLVPGHGREFNRALQDAALHALDLLGVARPKWQPITHPRFDFTPGQRVQVNPYRPGRAPWIGRVTGFTEFKVTVERDQPGHPHHGWLYRVAPNLLADAEITDAEIEALNASLDAILEEAIAKGDI
jgi:hypothetical protein